MVAPKIPFDVGGRVIKVGDTVAYPMKNGIYVILRVGKVVAIDLTRTKPFVSIQRHIWKPKFLWVIRADNTAIIESGPDLPAVPMVIFNPPQNNAVELTFASKTRGVIRSPRAFTPHLSGLVDNEEGDVTCR